MSDGPDDGGARSDRSGGSRAGPAPVASLDEIGPGEPGSEGSPPVGLFDAGQIGAVRADVTVADLGPAAARRPSRRLWAVDAESGAGSRGTTTGTPPGSGTNAGSGATTGSSSAGPIGSVDAAPDADLDADPLTVARSICLRLLTERARSRHELAQALHRKGVPEDAARAVLERFGEVGLIDDAAFAEQWVHSRHTGKGLGRRALAVELRRKGVADDVAGDALHEFDVAAEEQRARRLVKRRVRGMALGSPEQRASAARRLAGMLARKGYGAGIVYRVVREAIMARGAETDEFGTDDEVDDEVDDE
jgi:regulatory protein